MGPFSLLPLKSGINKEKKVVTIGDDSNYSIDMTVWGELAKESNANFFKIGQIMIFKSARVSEYNNRSLSAGYDIEDTFMAKPHMHKEVEKVSKWFQSAATIEELTLDMQTLSFFSSNQGSEIHCSMAEMIDLSLKNEEVMSGSKMAYYRVNCYLAYIPGVQDQSRSLIYLACGVCKKKVIDNSDSYYCETCN